METHLDQLASANTLRPQRWQVRPNGLSPKLLHNAWQIRLGPDNPTKSSEAIHARHETKSGRLDVPWVQQLRLSAGLSIAGPALGRPSANSNLPVTGTLPDHFAESVTLARNSQHSGQQASESQFRATWMLQVAAVVAICNTYNRNPPVRELRKGLFFRGGRRGAGIDSMSESFQTAFQTIYDLTGNLTTNHCRMASIQSSDNPRHAPSVQC